MAYSSPGLDFTQQAISYLYINVVLSVCVCVCVCGTLPTQKQSIEVYLQAEYIHMNE